ncbi:Ig-like domain-containing protein [Streptomyces sp. Ncost-T10-10d]|uniref:L,D-transpeptidase n=1 Tax=Streptomyces sp. Ncost-T10-10d TaxID=1839774 RepID=UPI00081D787C|nr:Ig-like domain-containing protein [Streptomyces sp. Ncost-T10-10d]SCF64734.1 Lipoprotein-anchoring transpeptidase ErfK/SrfK [Streptomyces sp. Ncost-T10-10d]
MISARRRIRRTAPLGRPVRLTLIAGTAVLGATLTACSGASASDSGKGSGHVAGKAPAQDTKISVNLQGGGATPGKPVKVTLDNGKLKTVTVSAAEGDALTGRISADGRTWTSDRPAAPGTTYSVEAKDTGGGSDKAGFTTAGADKVNKLTLAPGKNTTVGIAQPLSIVFDNPVKDRAAVEKALKVSTSNNTEGSWGWLQDYSGKDRVDWRPKEYWKSGTKVTLDADLNGIDSGPSGGWFVRDYRTTFTIGTNRVVKVDLDRHRLALKRDGKTVMDVPMSAGTPGGEKASWRGTAVLMAKEGTINMRSETVGLGDAYDKMVDSSMRLTWSGMYAHAAPWNAAYFGVANHSSGCVGMSDANAGALYQQVRVGDPFEITGADAKGTVAEGNGYGAWNVTWSDWQAKSALK